MTGRRSVWSDPRVIELSGKFVPASDEVWRLQNGTDPECALFRAMAEHGHYGGRPGETRQGIYVCSPSGKFLASVNSNRAERVLEMMRDGLAAWEKLPDDDRRLAAGTKVAPEHRWEDSFPADGLVLSMITRDLPLQCDPAQPCEIKWNQDRVWFSRGEARQWLPQDPREGAKSTLPEKLAQRLARFHLVDTVKGQTSRFRSSDIKESNILTTVVERAGPRVTLKISGATKAESPPPERPAEQRDGRDGRDRRRRGWRWRIDAPNGVSTQLLGHAVYDLERSAFVEFEMVALGQRWGRTRYNGRRRDAESGPLGYVFRLSLPGAPRIAPAFISSYEASWVKQPAGRRGG